MTPENPSENPERNINDPSHGPPGDETSSVHNAETIAMQGGARGGAFSDTLGDALFQAEDFQQGKISGEQRGAPIGHYTLLEQVGEGGFGTVWKAEQHEPVRRMVALKIIKLGMDTREVIARFEQERQALAVMDHPGIAKVLDAGCTSSGRPYFVMELVDGVPVTKFCDQEKLAVRDRLQIFLQVCAAVQHAHQKGIIHRDLKPSNILVARDDNGKPTAKVIDFGIAKATEGKLTDLTLFTAEEQMIGTPAYMSPEQAGLGGGAQDIDTRCDVYALGVVLYELLTGRPPFDPHTLLAAGYEEMRRIIREKEPPRPSTRLGTLQNADSTLIAMQRSSELPRLITTIRRELDWVVMKAMEKDRTRRYESANGFARDVERFLQNEPVSARPPSRAYRIGKFVRRNRAAAVTAAAILMALTAGVIFYIVQIRAERDEVLRNQEKTRKLLAESLAQNAELAAQRGQWKEAVGQWDAAFAAGHPRPTDVRIDRLEAMSLENQFDEARAEIAALDAMEIAPAQRAELSVWKAEDEFLHGRTEKGVALLRSIQPDALDGADAAYVRGLLSEDTPAALAAFREAVELRPHHHGANARLCYLLLFAGHREEALSRATGASVLFPQDYMLKLIVMQAQKLAGNQAEAARREAMLKDAPPLARAAITLSDDLTGMDQEILNNRGSDPTSLTKLFPQLLAVTQRMRNMTKRAGLNIEKYGAPYLSNVMSRYYDAGVKHFIQHNEREALVAIDKALEHHPLGEFLFLKGLVYMEMGDFPKAALVFEEGIKAPGMGAHSQVRCKSAAATALALAGANNPEFAKRAHDHYSSLLKVPNADFIGAENGALAAMRVRNMGEARAWCAMIPADAPGRGNTIALVESVAGDCRAALDAIHSVPADNAKEALFRGVRSAVYTKAATAHADSIAIQREALASSLESLVKLATDAGQPDATMETLEFALEDSRLAAQLHEALGELTEAASLIQRARKWLSVWQAKSPPSENVAELGPLFATVALRIPAALAEQSLAAKDAETALAAADDGIATLQDVAWLGLSEERMQAAQARLDAARASVAAMTGKTLPPVKMPIGSKADVKSLEAEVDTVRKARGPEHPDTLTLMIQLAGAYGADGSGRKSIKLGEEAVKLVRRVLPPGDPLTTAALKTLIANYRRVDRNEDAERLEEELAKGREAPAAEETKPDAP